jgi:phage terminase large subunit-like protein
MIFRASDLARLPAAERTAFLSSLSREEKEELAFRWSFWARDGQIPPGTDWFVQLYLAGRGFGKSRCGAEWVRSKAESVPACRIALVGRTAADYRDVMVEGESGLLAVCPPWNKPVWNPSTRKLTWPNGSIATCYSGDKPDQLRGPQHNFAWGDELAAWRYADDTWSNLLMGLRLGTAPQIVATTTPRPIRIIKELVKESTTNVTRGSTYDNLANLAETFQRTVIAKYEGTRLGRQELDGAILDDVAGALWTYQLLEGCRIRKAPVEFRRVVVAIDPAVSATVDSDETGIIVAALGTDGNGYVLDDLTLRDSPNGWASAAVKAYKHHNADRILAEINQGGAMVEHTIRTVDNSVSYKAVRAKVGKKLRAEPVAALYEQGKVHHLGSLVALEDQMASWVPGEGDSPDRVDALVYALTELMLGDTSLPTALPSFW